MVGDILSELAEWQYLKELAPELHGFSLKVNIKKGDKEVAVFSYDLPTLRKRVEVYYSLVTKDYMLRRVFGLNEYFDMYFISPERSIFEDMLKNSLDGCLLSMSDFSPERAGFLVREKGLLDWAYGHDLPRNIGSFELYIRPCEPVHLINGGMIVLDYSDFENFRQLVIYYNELRDEFYGEKKLNGVVYTTGLFDARDLKGLEKVLRGHLEVFLADFDG